jgi:hypothetical protein
VAEPGGQLGAAPTTVWLVPNRYGRFAADFNPWSQIAVEVGLD